MAYLNKHLTEKLKELHPLHQQLLETFLLDLNRARNDVEKRDAVTKLRSRIREIVAEEERR